MDGIISNEIVEQMRHACDVVDVVDSWVETRIILRAGPRLRHLQCLVQWTSRPSVSVHLPLSRKYVEIALSPLSAIHVVDSNVRKSMHQTCNSAL
jgi:hypothetical protein